jgi:peptidoglycan/LPS O-acetylase OafA/YrhL
VTNAETLGRPSIGYIPALDGLRALAVIIVILSHAELPGFAGGKSGVLIFFVLSGYLITSILLRELQRSDRIRFGRFYVRRLLRLYPALIAVTIVTAGVSVVLFLRSGNDTAEASLLAVPSVILYFNNWVPIFAPGTNMGQFSHFWSLAVEEQFYLVWPVLLLVIYRWKKLHGVLMVAAAGATLSLVFKIFLWDGGGARQGGTDFASDGLLLGCSLAALLAMTTLPRWIGRWSFWPGVIGLAVATALGNSGTGDAAAYETYGRVYWPIAVVSAVLVVAGLVTATAPGPARWILETRPMVYLGRISYGMYLWHILVMTLVRAVADSSIIIALLSLAGTIAIASASFYGIERPFLRKKQRYENDPGAAQADKAQYGTATRATGGPEASGR